VLTISIPYSAKAVTKNKKLSGVFNRENKYIPPRYLLAVYRVRVFLIGLKGNKSPLGSIRLLARPITSIVKKILRIGLPVSASYVAFVFYGSEIFSLFSTEPEMIATGALYLKIFAVSQVFMCIEITSTGGFYGLGKTKPPAFISIVFTGLKIPAALLVVALTTYTYDGVWWCVSISSVFKGIIVMVMYVFTLKKL